MTGLWQLVAAEATTNLVTNPSFEVNTNGWAYTSTGSLARATNDPPSGLYNLAVTPAAGEYSGCVYIGYPVYSGLSFTAGVTYVGSLYFKGPVGVPFRLHFTTTGGVGAGEQLIVIGDGKWHRYEFSWLCDSTDTYYLYVTKYGSATTAAYYIDAVQVEAKAYSTTYCDGSLTPPIGFTSSGCSWAGVAHASASSRTANSRAGGLVKNLDDFYFYVTNPTGIGAAPVTNYFTEYAVLAGALHGHTKVNSRVMILNGIVLATSLATLHSRRSTLLAALRPTETEEPLRLRYTGGTETLELSAYYDGGMEAGVREGFNERLGLRFYAPTPNWREVVV